MIGEVKKPFIQSSRKNEQLSPNTQKGKQERTVRLPHQTEDYVDPNSSKHVNDSKSYICTQHVSTQEPPVVAWSPEVINVTPLGYLRDRKLLYLSHIFLTSQSLTLFESRGIPIPVAPCSPTAASSFNLAIRSATMWKAISSVLTDYTCALVFDGLNPTLSTYDFTGTKDGEEKDGHDVDKEEKMRRKKKVAETTNPPPILRDSRTRKESRKTDRRPTLSDSDLREIPRMAAPVKSQFHHSLSDSKMR